MCKHAAPERQQSTCGARWGFRSAPKERAFYANVARAHHADSAGGSAAAASGVGGSARQPRDRQRVSEVEALREIDADAFELLQHGFRLDALGDGGDAERPSYLADGLHHAAIDRILGDVADE